MLHNKYKIFFHNLAQFGFLLKKVIKIVTKKPKPNLLDFEQLQILKCFATKLSFQLRKPH